MFHYRFAVVAGTALLAPCAALAALLAVGAPTAQATSAALTPTRIALSPASQSVTYASPAVTIQGTLETLVAAGKTPQVLADEPVSIALEVDGQRLSIPLTTASTDASGQFSVTATVPAPGVVKASFAGDSSYAAGSGSASVTAAAALPAEFVFSPVPPSPAYSTVTATGQLLMQTSGGSWVPAPYAPLAAVQGEDISTSAWTDGNGDFSLTFRVDPAYPPQLFSAGGRGATWSGTVSSARLIVPLSVFPTQAQVFPGPSIQDLRDMSFGGTVDYVNSQDQVLPLAGATAQLCYQPMGSTTCIARGSATSDADGSVSFTHVSGYLPGGKLALASGLWYLNVPATATYLASDASTGEQVYVPVWLNGVRITHSGKRAYLTGVLDDDHHAGPVAGQRVTIAWGHHKATAKTGANGDFRFLLTGRPAGTYVVSYAGHSIPGGAYIPATPGEHVRVRYRP
jgi:hypothetical protein